MRAAQRLLFVWHVAAHHYTELVCWQLGDEVRRHTLVLTRRQPFQRDIKLRSQAEDAADSVCRNIAEGFGCSSHLEFARFLEISRRSLNEVTDCLHSARLRGYVSVEEAARIKALTRRLYPALGSLIAYLRRRPGDRHRHGADKR